MSRSSSATSSWVLPFALGSAASLSVMWISQNWNQISALIQKTLRISCSTVRRQNRNELLDAPDLDHRMLRKCEAVIQWRTSRLLLVIERCTNDHNYSAILRTAEALGIKTVFVVDPPNRAMMDTNGDSEDDVSPPHQQQQQLLLQLQKALTQEEIEQRRLHHLFAQKATEWLTVRDFETSEACIAEIRRLGYELWVTDLSQEAEALSMSPAKLPDKIALVMGTEAVGASQCILNAADKRVYLPLRGFADSLNLSVSTALIIHHLFLIDPSLIGAMSDDERKSLRKAWYVKLTQQRLLSSSQKRTRVRLLGQIKKCEAIFQKTRNDPTYMLQDFEQKKLDQWPKFQQELEAIDAVIEPSKVEAAIQEWLDNPPEALTDLRRAETHRVCFVGKNTREVHKEHWKDMAATSNSVPLHGATSTVFRDKVDNATMSDEGMTPEQEEIELSQMAPNRQRRPGEDTSSFIEKHF